jgi:hypothetical protein
MLCVLIMEPNQKYNTYYTILKIMKHSQKTFDANQACFKHNSSSIQDHKSGYNAKWVFLDFLLLMKLFEFFTCHKNIYYTTLHNHFKYFQIQCWVGPKLMDLSVLVTFWLGPFIVFGPW